MQGTVERITRKNGRTALKIGGEWYSTFESVDAREGDHVEFSYMTVEKNGREYKNLKALEVLVAAAPEAGELPESERIARSVALKCAVETCGLNCAAEGSSIETDKVLTTAEAFLEFLLGGRGGPGEDDGRLHDRTELTEEENPF